MLRAMLAPMARPVLREYRTRRDRAAARRRLSALPARLSASPQYHDYLVSQLLRSHRMREYVAADRVRRLIADFLEVNPHPVTGRAVLCIGCRNAHELDVFTEAGYPDVTGIDLFSDDPRIRPMDMHCLAFPSNRFDVIFACHSLEHAFDVDRVVAEVRRVARRGAICVIEVPVRFRRWPGREDLQDFESAEGLLQACAALVDTVLFARDVPGENWLARAAFTIRPVQDAG